MNFKSYLLLLLMVLPGLAHALDPFIVTDVQVEGNQRISAGTIFNYLPVKVGDQVNAELAQDSIKALFKTGFFKDVQLSQSGSVLVVLVVERPSIATITLEGNKDIEDDALRSAMSGAGFEEGKIFNPEMLSRLSAEVKAQYLNRGKYNADVKSTVTPLERNRVSVTLRFIEGDTAKIKRVNIIGNKFYKESELTKKFSLNKKSVFSLLSKKDRYSKEKLSADLENLVSFYQDRGFLDFSIDSTQVSLTPDKKEIFVTINISEGQRYTVSDFSINGKVIVPEKELSALVTIVPGAEYSRKQVEASRKAILNRLAEDGYAFANVNPIPELDKANNKVSFSFFIDPGRRVYVRRISISGNTSTRDEVIRRELRQLEGSWYSIAKVNRSRIRLQKLGYFESVKIDTPAVPGSPDQLDLNVVVSERSTGSFLFGAGFSDADGILLQVSASEKNLFGTGKELTINLDNSDVSEVASVRYINPYYTADGISRGFNISRRTIDAAEASTAEYITETLGVGIDYTFPLSELDSLSLGFSAERIDLSSTAETPSEIESFITAFPQNDVIRFNGNYSRDSRNNFLFPSDGSLQRFSWEIAVPGGDLEYYKLTYQNSFYIPIGKSLVFKVGGEISYGDGYGDTEGLPFFKNYFAGGSSSVRGYQSRSLGPRDSGDTPEPLGGSRRLLANAELLFPLPGLNSNDKRIGFFVDAGQVYGVDESLTLSDLRFSAGLSFSWLSPLGPLGLSYGVALNEEAGDETESIQISLGRFFR